MKQALIDTSVLVSAFLFPDSVPGQIVQHAKEGRFSLHFSPIILEELDAALARGRLQRSYGYGDDDAARWCDALKQIGTLLTTSLPDIGSVCRDPDDDHVIAAAVAVNAGWIITGDKDLLALKNYGEIQIVTARNFIEAVG